MKPSDARLLYGSLVTFPPWMQFHGGLVLFLAGTGGTIVLWQAGWVAGVFLGAMGTGLATMAMARGRMKEKAALDRQIAIVMEREEELVARVAEMRRAKQPPFRWLEEQGIRDIRIRSYLIAAADGRQPA